MDIDKGGAGDDIRMPADDEVVSGEEASDRSRQTEQAGEDRALVQPAVPRAAGDGEGQPIRSVAG